ncbi:ABC transporter ATP-binding protein [Parapusillimonas granuli]|uniref:ABC transporter ATP-binding protein n=1 Tax=Parapusillimonas granuli TaxID=380911 RepID=A0A853G9I4_9BURK|nr:ABC transporter ATP-binding protein [Parapusillimonas granuli]MBB5214282.1 spermidine/putrescine ABC transporter ATP-binding subunit [Parapusillimonas granuli]NYT51386.1 ABC transporter ATP-binding protein [Parapusillimonas granuli]
MSSLKSGPQGVGLEIRHIHKHYGAFHALKDIHLNVPPGALLTLLGPSGCGKSTLLRIIAGFIGASEGSILLDGVDVAAVPPFQRQTAMVFQNYALFPHMTVAENVMFGLKMRKVPKAQAKQRAMEALEMVKLSHLADRVPAQLSGGQQQRAALARALVTDPKVLLLDEPFGALDKNLREEMQVELRKLQESVGVTTVCVTHDQQEAMVISDYVAVMNHGVLEQFGTPLEIYDTPKSHFVATFIGSSNILQGRVSSHDDRACEVQLADGTAGRMLRRGGFSAGADVRIAVRPSAMRAIAADAVQQGDDSIMLKGTVGYCVNLGNVVNYEVEVPGFGTVMVEQPRSQTDALWSRGQPVHLVAHMDDCVILER